MGQSNENPENDIFINISNNSSSNIVDELFFFFIISFSTNTSS